MVIWYLDLIDLVVIWMTVFGLVLVDNHSVVIVMFGAEGYDKITM